MIYNQLIPLLRICDADSVTDVCDEAGKIPSEQHIFACEKNWEQPSCPSTGK